ncbi:DUF2306 domain-containing protein [Rubrivirga sp. S365]|uniref:DUF2306 domain-containing protein n=1 Tax=Rubrivirga litoralis TaxID=3075598 RepID=A0ABU3BLG9_9BACT|nr:MULTISPECIES: DUF2306 domain-containing protein [unclassified Rubrivirga]MDT0630139.1 DUF2306 domain-containing protein [Rubrivirga sp. F394]MDT7855650.1 DUF2306 domain-containing protein [Rubrivirga sp. S365]
MSATAVFHTALGALALVTGAVVLARPKGGPWHRVVGRVYVVSMVVLCLASFGLRDSTPLFRGFGGFHVAAIVSLVTVSAGAWSAWRGGRTQRAGWLPWHYMWMAWSYIGLVMATGGHVARPIDLAFRDAGLSANVAVWLSVAVVWGLPPLVGRWWIARRLAAWDALGARLAPGSVPA